MGGVGKQGGLDSKPNQTIQTDNRTSCSSQPMHGWNSIPDRNQQVIKWKEEFDDQTCMWCSEPLFCDESHGELLFSKQCKQAMDIFQSNGNAVCLIQNFLWIFIEEKFPFPKCCHVLRLCSRTLLRVSAMTTTTRFPLFKASIVNPAVGKGAGWIRSEILIIFLFLLPWLDF